MAQADVQDSKDDANGTPPFIKLANNAQIPQLGFGTSKLSPNSGQKAIEHALKVGYRHIDTARFYRTENMVGNAIIKSKIPRSQLYITTKIWSDEKGTNNCIQAIESSLKTLQTPYIDLGLIHSPIGGKNIETYQALLKLQNQGKIKSVGVSNFNTFHLEAIKDAKLALPSINQIELHPWCQHSKVVEYCRQNGIIVEAYSPLAKGKKLNKIEIEDNVNEEKEVGKDDENDNYKSGKHKNKNKKKKKTISKKEKMIIERHNQQIDILNDLSKKYVKSKAQILIRWSLQQAFVCLVKSENLLRIEANFNVWDFQISQQDMKTLSQFDENYKCAWYDMDPINYDIKKF